MVSSSSQNALCRFSVAIVPISWVTCIWTAVIPQTEIAFTNPQFNKTLSTNERGVYETDLHSATTLSIRQLLNDGSGFRLQTLSKRTVSCDFIENRGF